MTVDLLDRVVYVLKKRVPASYTFLSAVGRICTCVLYGRAIRQAIAAARIDGSVCNTEATIRVLEAGDVGKLEALLSDMPEEHLTFFHPHGLDRDSLEQVIARGDIMTYGLFVDDRLCAYAILKLFPTKKAYIGRLVSPSMVGMGIGRFLSRYLYWQAHLLGFQPCSTIHEDNVASLRSHAAVRPFRVAAALPGGYRLVKFELLPEDAVPPELRVEAARRQAAPSESSDPHVEPSGRRAGAAC